MALAGHHKVDLARPGHKVAMLVAKTQGPVLNDAQGVAVMAVPGKGLLLVSGVKEFHTGQAGRAGVGEEAVHVLFWKMGTASVKQSYFETVLFFTKLVFF